MDKQNFIKFFGPPEGNVDVPLIYHTSLQFDQVQKGYPWREIREAALNYYSGSNHSSTPTKSWKEIISILFDTAKREREKEIELLGSYIDEKVRKDWETLSWSKDREGVLNNYKDIIIAINEFLGNKEFFDFAKKISALKMERKEIPAKERRQLKEIFSLVQHFADGIKKEVLIELFSDDGIYSTNRLRKLFEENRDAEVVKIIEKEMKRGFGYGLIRGKITLEKALKEQNINDPEIIKLMDSLIINKNFLDIIEKYATQTPGIRYLKEGEVKEKKIRDILKEPNFSDQDLKNLIEEVKENFEVKIERTPGQISKMNEDAMVEVVLSSLAIDSGKLSSVKNLKNETYSLDSIAIITENKDMKNAIENFVENSNAKNKIEARKEYQDLMIELEKMASEVDGIPEKYTVINFNTKTYIKDSKFSAGGERKIQDIDFMLSEVTNTTAFTNRLAQFGVGFLFNSKKMGEDLEIVHTLGKLLIFIGGFLFEGFKSIGSDLHSGVNILYLNHYMVPFSFVLFSLLNSLTNLENSLSADGIKSRSRSRSKEKAKSVQVFDKNTTAHLNLRIKKTMMGEEERYKFYDKGLSATDPERFISGWREQSDRALNAITIEASFLNEFHKHMNNLLN